MGKPDYGKLQNGSDIRGIALPGVPGEEVNLDGEAAGRLACGFLYLLMNATGKGPEALTVALGRDPRLSGGDLARAIGNALSSHGVKVLDYGPASTPAMFMSTVFPEIDADGAIMITASHMPGNRNGMKMFTKDGGLDKGDITDIITFAESDQILGQIPTAANSAGPDTEPVPDLMELYCAHLRDLIIKGVPGAAETSSVNDDTPLSGMKIAVDAGNGGGGFFATKVLEPLGADISASRFLEPDGTFPNHPPNPENKDAMAAITAATVGGGCDLGLIFDTDVDRSSAVDETGREIARNGIVAMAAALIADEFPGTTVVTDSVTSVELTDFLENDLGLKHFRFKRGYRNVINKAKELCDQGIDSQLAIETSGHAAYRNNYFLDDGAYLATLIVIRAARLFKEGKMISEVIKGLKEPAESAEIRLPITAEDFVPCADAALEAVTALTVRCDIGSEDHCTVSDRYGLSFDLVTPNYEGVRVNYRGEQSGWFLLRKSLHDPILPLNIESRAPGGVEAVKRALFDCLSHITGVDVSLLKQ